MQTIERINHGLFERASHNPSFEQVRAGGGHPGTVLDFCVPVNAYFPPDALLRRITDNLEGALKYYPDYADVHQDNISALTGIPARNIVVANGSTEIITLLCVQAQGPVVTSIPTFGRWTDLPSDFGIATSFIERRAERDFRLDVDEVVTHVAATKARTVVLCNPNNPTGAAFSRTEVEHLLVRLRAVPLVVLDESFIDFSDQESCERLAMETDNTVVVKSMGKALGWHGIRLGYAVAAEEIARRLRKRTPYWNINGVAASVLRQLPDFRKSYLASFTKMKADRAYMLGELTAIEDVKVYPSQANFLYTELPHGVSGKAVRDKLLAREGLLVRECSNKIGSSERYLRLAVHPRAAADRLAAALAGVLALG